MRLNFGPLINLIIGILIIVILYKLAFEGGL